MSIKAQEKGSRQACSKSYPQGGWDRGSNCQCCGQGSNAPQTHLPAADVEQGVKPILIQLPGTPDPDDLAGQHGLADASLPWNTTVLTGCGWVLLIRLEQRVYVQEFQGSLGAGAQPCPWRATRAPTVTGSGAPGTDTAWWSSG